MTRKRQRYSFGSAAVLTRSYGSFPMSGGPPPNLLLCRFGIFGKRRVFTTESQRAQRAQRKHREKKRDEERRKWIFLSSLSSVFSLCPL